MSFSHLRYTSSSASCVSKVGQTIKSPWNLMQQFQAFLYCMFYELWQPVTILRSVWLRSARMQTLYLSYSTTGLSPWPGFPHVKPSVSVLKAVVTVGESDGDAAGTFRSLRYALRDASILTPIAVIFTVESHRTSTIVRLILWFVKCMAASHLTQLGGDCPMIFIDKCDHWISTNEVTIGWRIRLWRVNFVKYL